MLECYSCPVFNYSAVEMFLNVLTVLQVIQCSGSVFQLLTALLLNYMFSDIQSKPFGCSCGNLFAFTVCCNSVLF